MWENIPFKTLRTLGLRNQFKHPLTGLRKVSSDWSVMSASEVSSFWLTHKKVERPISKKFHLLNIRKRRNMHQDASHTPDWALWHTTCRISNLRPGKHGWHTCHTNVHVKGWIWTGRKAALAKLLGFRCHNTATTCHMKLTAEHHVQAASVR